MPDTNKPRVRPRDAASLVVVRGRGAGARVLLGRRAAAHDFMPGVYVFPGGRMEAGDARAVATSELRPEIARRLTARWPQSLARGLAVAALRETFEETGLAFGEVNGGMLRPALHVVDYVARAITPAGSPKRFHARFFLARAEDAIGRVSGASGELLDLRWHRVDEALKLPIIDVTANVLHEVGRRLAAPELVPRYPFMRYHGRHPRLDYE